MILQVALRKRDTALLVGDKGYVRCMRHCALRGEGVKYSSLHSFNENPRYSRYSEHTTRYWVDTRYSAELFHGTQDIRILYRAYKMEYGICLYTQDIGLNSEGGRGERVSRRIKPQDIVEYKKNRYKM
nr:MAG TPA_asm: hypothetical protein [Caudoviricetes sp.]